MRHERTSACVISSRRATSQQTGAVHELIRGAALDFLRGETSDIDFTYAFRNAISAVAGDRPLEQHEVRIFDPLERGKPPAGRAARRSSTSFGLWFPLLGK